MRRTTMLAAVSLMLFAAGCGTQAGDDGAAVSPSPSGSSACAPPSGELGAKDSGRTVCLAAGDTVRVSLNGTNDRAWTAVTAEGDGLEPVNSGIALPPGDSNAAYRATGPGTARLTSSRPLCATEPGKVSCKGIQEWWVKVVVK
ncbi:hypothetical protein ACIPSE_07620 [Streptomyces sp. NPDC090106]|uniref:hypothetical protein n=1 Tax=Streptomyces sp. NPDC090106 TaxID=3365946 RepID=UPI0037FAA937